MTLKAPLTAPTIPTRSTLEVETTEEGAELWDMYQDLAESGDMLRTRTSPLVRRRGRRGRSNLKTMTRVPRAWRSLSLNVIVEVDLSLEAVRDIQSAPPARLRRGMAKATVSAETVEGQIPPSLTPAHFAWRGRGCARGCMTRKQMPTNADVTQAPTIGMEEDGQPNGREWNNQCPETVNEVSVGITLNVHVDENILEGFNTLVGIRPTIQPDIIPPRLTCARQRLLELNTAVAQEVPLKHEDITAVDCLRLNLHDTMDSVFPSPMRMELANRPVSLNCRIGTL